MSNFNNPHEMFMKPKTEQFGSHMVMTNVHQTNKTKYISIDSKYKDDYQDNNTTNSHADLLSNQLSTSNFQITLPERISNVKSITMTHAEIPLTYYNISSNLGNNYFKVVESGTETMITLEDGFYYETELQNKINSLLAGQSIDLTLTISSVSKTSIVAGGGTYSIHFDVNSQGIHDKYRIKSKLGWLLGFRLLNYDITNTLVSSEEFSNINGSKYLYLAIDEFSKGNQNSFMTPLHSSLINKNILSRISLDNSNYVYGAILPANLNNGYLVSDTRSYNGNVDIQKLNIQLLNEDGLPVILNGLDFSFCLKVEYL